MSIIRDDLSLTQEASSKLFIRSNKRHKSLYTQAARFTRVSVRFAPADALALLELQRQVTGLVLVAGIRGLEARS